MKLKIPSYPVLAAIAYAMFAAIGLAIWYPLLSVGMPVGASKLQTLQDLLAFEPGGQLLGLHTVASLAAAAFAVILFMRPNLNRSFSLTAAVMSGLFALAAWALYRSDTALLPTVAAVALAWNYFKPQVPHSEA